MSYALIVHNELPGVDGGALGASLNTWYRRKLTDNPINEDTIVQAINTTAGSYAFTLGPGTYRMEAEMSFYLLYNFGTSATNATAVAVLYNDTDASVVAAFSPTYQSDIISSLSGSGAGALTTIAQGRMVTLSCLTIFTITSAKVFSFRGAGSGTETWVDDTTACGITHGGNAAVSKSQPGNQYLVAKIVSKTNT